MPQDPTDPLSILEGHRKYASFFEFGEKWQKELSVGEELIRALNAEFGFALTDLSVQDPDPPDLTCRNGAERIAIEVTELVCAKAVRANERGREDYREWRPGEVAAALQALVQRKDSAKLCGGPYDSHWLCIFTDEFTLTAGVVAKQLEAVRFGPVRQINQAFVLFSYEPGRPTYPVVPLQLGA